MRSWILRRRFWIGAAPALVATVSLLAPARASSVPTQSPRNSSPPMIRGTARVGSILTAVTVGTWTGTRNTVYYRWQRLTRTGWRAVFGAHASAYRLTSSDLGTRVRLLVTESNGYGSLSVPSNVTVPVAPAPPLNTSPPVITGTPRARLTLWARTGGWTEPAKFDYRWQHSATGSTWRNIAGARRRRYTVTQAEAGSLLRVIVSATGRHGSSSATSAPVGIPPVSMTAPGLPSGVLASASTLTADAGRWNPGGVVLTFSWQRCPSDATAISPSCTVIGSGRSYTLAAADAGSRIAVSVTATAPGGAASADSPITELVGSAAVTVGGVLRAVPHSFLGVSTETNEFNDFVQKVPSFPALLGQLAVPGDGQPRLPAARRGDGRRHLSERRRLLDPQRRQELRDRPAVSTATWRPGALSAADGDG